MCSRLLAGSRAKDCPLKSPCDLPSTPTGTRRRGMGRRTTTFMDGVHWPAVQAEVAQQDARWRWKSYRFRVAERHRRLKEVSWRRHVDGAQRGATRVADLKRERRTECAAVDRGRRGPKVASNILLDGADVADATYKPATAPMHPSTRSDFATPDGRPVNNRRMYLPPHSCCTDRGASTPRHVCQAKCVGTLAQLLATCGRPRKYPRPSSGAAGTARRAAARRRP